MRRLPAAIAQARHLIFWRAQTACGNDTSFRFFSCLRQLKLLSSAMVFDDRLWRGTGNVRHPSYICD
jgi:hypothetical protein